MKLVKAISRQSSVSVSCKASDAKMVKSVVPSSKTTTRNYLSILAKMADSGLLSKVEESKLLSKIEEEKILTAIEESKFLSKAESSGLLTQIEDSGVLSIAEKSGALGIIADPATPSTLNLAGFLFIISAAASVYESSDNILVDVASGMLGMLGISLVAGGSFLSKIQRL
ncbi:hypothetical protein CEUSTIGMA_g3491.t1 [Chlamydomonas eustigma]|uniref:Uncharacterized protein n=1 Tax=Chlamydomonas eustigma TaxID=1157962 RepID=A0A250WYY1_9CHLO|nr:hypothetical protein CEUSTIGMA_g3491.t1 [Chlamydomonas eustigma]|eukprot:GAX76048.1 hypothetical protein CEUSTIGMA_g3491.t1 [Chlamydomonas eustigma]